MEKLQIGLGYLYTYRFVDDCAVIFLIQYNLPRILDLPDGPIMTWIMLDCRTTRGSRPRTKRLYPSQDACHCVWTIAYTIL